MRKIVLTQNVPGSVSYKNKFNKNQRIKQAKDGKRRWHAMTEIHSHMP